MELTPPETPVATTHLPSTWKRLIAVQIDGLILFVPVIATGLASQTIEIDASGQVRMGWAIVGAGMTLSFFYHVLFLRFQGATPGKLLFGLEVCNADQSPGLSWGKSILRPAVSQFVGLFLNLLPQSIAFFRPDRRQLADLAAGTQVLQKTPRHSMPTKRWFIGSLLVLYTLFSALTSLKSFHQTVGLTAQGIVIHTVPLGSTAEPKK